MQATLKILSNFSLVTSFNRTGLENVDHIFDLVEVGLERHHLQACVRMCVYTAMLLSFLF
jgi:hypothetical protein